MYSGNAALSYGPTLAWNCMKFLQSRASLYLAVISPAHLLHTPHHGVLFKCCKIPTQPSRVLRIVRNLGDNTWLVHAEQMDVSTLAGEAA